MCANFDFCVVFVRARCVNVLSVSSTTRFHLLLRVSFSCFSIVECVQVYFIVNMSLFAAVLKTVREVSVDQVVALAVSGTVGYCLHRYGCFDYLSKTIIDTVCGKPPSIPPSNPLFDNGECAICQSPHNNKSYPPCGHVFCLDCLTRWIKRPGIIQYLSFPKCPMCRKQFSTFIHSMELNHPYQRVQCTLSWK